MPTLHLPFSKCACFLEKCSLQEMRNSVPHDAWLATRKQWQYAEALMMKPELYKMDSKLPAESLDISKAATIQRAIPKVGQKCRHG